MDGNQAPASCLTNRDSPRLAFLSSGFRTFWESALSLCRSPITATLWNNEIGRAHVWSPCNLVCRLLLDKKKNSSSQHLALSNLAFSHDRAGIFLKTPLAIAG